MTNREKHLITASWISGALWVLNEFSTVEKGSKILPTGAREPVKYLGPYPYTQVFPKIQFQSDAIITNQGEVTENTAEYIIRTADEAIKLYGHGSDEPAV